jgi:hypothetical protein
VDEAGRNPSRTNELLEPSSASLATAAAAVEAATAMINRVATAWGELTSRTVAAASAATEAGDLMTARAARTLAGLLARDPFAVNDADLTSIEALSASAERKHAAAKLAASRIDIDLAQARTILATLDADLQSAGEELVHAADRIVGVPVVDPVPDIDSLADWLDRIAALVGRDSARASSDLTDWVAAAQARRAELDRALTPARDGLRRREQGRGLWKALRAKASARRLDEQDDVAAALDDAQAQLWNAPCDLGAADAALARLAALLEAVSAGDT